MKFEPGSDTGSLALREVIVARKIPTIVPFLGPDPLKYDRHDALNQRYILGREYYEYLYAIAELFRIERFLEIGVRYGYSAMALAAGARETLKYFEGWDICQMDRKSNEKAIDLIERNPFIKCDYKILDQDSFKVDEIPGHFDLIYVDGAHREAEKWHDFMLCLNSSAKYMVVDDCKHDPEAPDDDWWPLLLKFINENEDRIEDYTLIETHNHGTGVVIFK